MIMSNELLLALTSILATMVGAWMTVLKRQADTRAKVQISEAENQKKKAEAEAAVLLKDAEAKETAAKVTLREAEARVRQAEAQAVQFDQLMNLIKEQLRINQEQTRQADTWADILRQKEKADERNYAVIRQLTDDNTRYLDQQLIAASTKLIEAINQVPAKIELLNVEAVKIMAAEIGREVGAQVAERVVAVVREIMTTEDETKALTGEGI